MSENKYYIIGGGSMHLIDRIGGAYQRGREIHLLNALHADGRRIKRTWWA